MRKDDVAVASIMWARTRAEESRLVASLHELARTGLRVAIADGGSPDHFVDRVRAIPGIVVLEPPIDEPRGLVAQVRRSVRHAAGWGTPHLLYTEPDKLEFFRDHLDRFIDAAPDRPDVGVVVASRSPSSFATFPENQQETERLFNRLCSRVVGAKADYTYGPFLMARRLAPLVERVEPDLGWGWRPFVFASACALDLRVESVAGDFDCPEDQRAEAEPEYRLNQLGQNVEGLLRSGLDVPSG